MDTLGIENFISVKATEGPKLVKALEEHVDEYGVDVINLQKAKKIHVPNDSKDKFQLELQSGARLKSKTLQSHFIDLMILLSSAAAAGGLSSSWLGMFINANFFILFFLCWLPALHRDRDCL